MIINTLFYLIFFIKILPLLITIDNINIETNENNIILIQTPNTNQNKKKAIFKLIFTIIFGTIISIIFLVLLTFIVIKIYQQFKYNKRKKKMIIKNNDLKNNVKITHHSSYKKSDSNDKPGPLFYFYNQNKKQDTENSDISPLNADNIEKLLEGCIQDNYLDTFYNKKNITFGDQKLDNYQEYIYDENNYPTKNPFKSGQ